ncbi:hypothetical protein Asp14428_60470 [Actinoplanes sp. NBRC 14428]|nr:hypothetical protein Asp14428_60470 [Actinoplanes sp. NBRC 14428]
MYSTSAAIRRIVSAAAPSASRTVSAASTIRSRVLARSRARRVLLGMSRHSASVVPRTVAAAA